MWYPSSSQVNSSAEVAPPIGLKSSSLICTEQPCEGNAVTEASAALLLEVVEVRADVRNQQRQLLQDKLSGSS